MLILTRRIGESLVIGDDVTITVLGIKGGQVRLGINAPITVSIHREEIHNKIKHEQQLNGSNSNVNLSGKISNHHSFAKIEDNNIVEPYSENKEVQKYHRPKKPHAREKLRHYHDGQYESRNNLQKLDNDKSNFNHASHVKNSSYARYNKERYNKDKIKLFDDDLENSQNEDSIGNV